jgi:RNA polymerase sigma-70 factor (ECF subfamily)
MMDGSVGSDHQWRRLFEGAVAKSSVRLFRIAYGVLRNESAAEDACQQGFQKVWARRATIQENAVTLHAYLCQTMLNESLQSMRRRKIEKRVLALEHSTQRSSAVAEAADPLALPEAIAAALSELPQRQRIVVTLRCLQELTGNETAQTLGLGASAVSEALHQGLKSLKPLLADCALRGSRTDGMRAPQSADED